MRKKLLSIFILGSSLLVLTPLYIVFVNTFKTRDQIFNNPFAISFAQNDYGLFQNYKEAWEMMQFGTSFMNSLIITVLSIGLIVLTTSMAAWVIVRKNNKTSKAILTIFIISMLIPFQALMIPMTQWYSMVSKAIPFLKLIDTRYGLIFSYMGFGIALSIFLFSAFIRNIPIELEEAAVIDGYSRPQIFFKVVLPLLKPVIATVSVLNLIWIWNDYLLPSILISSPDKRTIPLQTYYFFGSYNTDWSLALSGLVLTIIPIALFYVFAQKYIIKGVTDGAIK